MNYNTCGAGAVAQWYGSRLVIVLSAWAGFKARVRFYCPCRSVPLHGMLLLVQNFMESAQNL